MPETICDTAPIQYLYQIGLLDLLPNLFGRVTVPDAVVSELAEGRDIGVPLPDPLELSWVDVRSVSVPSVLRLVQDLGPGEREVLALALEQKGARVLTDDRLARNVAQGLHIPLTGTLGVLLRAKAAGHLEAVKPLIERLESLRFRLDAQTRAAVLKLAGEGGDST